jgi:hypothetical protein
MFSDRQKVFLVLVLLLSIILWIREVATLLNLRTCESLIPSSSLTHKNPNYLLFLADHFLFGWGVVGGYW